MQTWVDIARLPLTSPIVIAFRSGVKRLMNLRLCGAGFSLWGLVLARITPTG